MLEGQLHGSYNHVVVSVRGTLGATIHPAGCEQTPVSGIVVKFELYELYFWLELYEL